MNSNPRLNVDTYFNHIRDTNRVFLNYINLLEIQERNLTSLLNERTTRDRINSYYPRTRTNLNERTTRRATPSNVFSTNRLNYNEIAQNTNIYNFRDVINPLNNSCPITFEDFLPNSRVMMINHCRHIFNENSLRSWFTYNTQCPLCRHNIRNNRDVNNHIESFYTNPQYNIPETNVNNTTDNSNTTDISNNLSNIFDNIINSYSNHNNSNTNPGETSTTFTMGTIYDNTTRDTLQDISNNSQTILNQWNENIMSRLSELLEDDISGNIRLEYRMYST